METKTTIGNERSGEIGYRIQQQVRARIEQLSANRLVSPAPHSRCAGAPWVDPLPQQLDAGKYCEAADAILEGRFNVFALRGVALGFPPQWNRDPKTGICAPTSSFGKTLDYRNEALVGDIKYLWEPSRHFELVTLAQAWRLSGEERYARGCRLLLESWWAQCPYPYGVHWTSSLEHAVRLINWSFAWTLLGGEKAAVFADENGAAFRERWLASIYQHCYFIANHLSRFSSANNHLLGELTGLFVATSLWPLWKQCAVWNAQARRELEREALSQNGADGVNKEQATWYHQEVLDMLVLAGLTARANGADFSAQYWRRVRGMLDYIASIMDAGGSTPMFGDADDAVVVRLDPAEDFDAYRSMLATGAVLFESAQLKFKAGKFDDKARWLLGDAAKRSFDEIEASPDALPITRRFNEAGYYILGCDFETPQEIRIVADAGPLGFLSIAAHGHADALSFTLSVAGREMLIDPGTYAYHTQKVWRDYFRGTSAHNTLRVDGQDQSVIGGAFLWSRHARATTLEADLDGPVQRLLASHDGYERLDDPVRHQREFVFDANARVLRLIDDVHCTAAHTVEIFLHFAEQCRVEQQGSTIIAANGPVRLVIGPPEGFSWELLRGEERPPLGWASRRFDVRSPITTLRMRRDIAGAVRMATVIAVEQLDARTPSVTRQGGR